ncbi:NUDIX hydrolase [Vibrio gallicus]|uniref:NUDIX hydrolase n=1 Tax=Vibrio gallicus TaxID=190897 RepID=UPI0021C4252B|nr:NUDIX hydrolase [Vibrio gallicus]
MHKIIHKWKSLSLVEEPLILPNKLAISHTSIRHPGAVVILAKLDDNTVLLLNQYRPSIKQWLLEIPAGTMKQDESPLIAAKRELEEETGYSAKRWQSLGTLTPMAGFCNEVQHLFVAEELHLENRLHKDDEEVIELQTITCNDLLQAIQRDDITDAKTIATVAKAMLCGKL